MKLILLGAPGAGKGTQAERISERYSIPQISTGNLIRAALKSGTDIGLRAKAYIDEGHLVPDDMVLEILGQRLSDEDCSGGFILDGFPRTISQAEALDRMGIDIDAVIDIEVSDADITRRLSGRRVCGSCGATYHLEYNPPKVSGVCDKCSDALIQRTDDHPDKIAERLRVYHEQTEPLRNYYESRGKLRVVSGQESIEDTTRQTFAAIEG